jgi:hypothetical protein
LLADGASLGHGVGLVGITLLGKFNSRTLLKGNDAKGKISEQIAKFPQLAGIRSTRSDFPRFHQERR